MHFKSNIIQICFIFDIIFFQVELILAKVILVVLSSSFLSMEMSQKHDKSVSFHGEEAALFLPFRVCSIHLNCSSYV
jgi:hypothetical protein